MDKLWAPWRMKYISQKKQKSCIFCQVFKEKKDKQNFILLRSTYCFAILNTYPYNNGHVMIVPNRHLKSMESLNDAELLDMNKTLIKIKSKLKKVLNPKGFNIGINIGTIAGAGIANHLHAHIVPRWRGDVNFMPIISNTKVISQSLKELYKKLKQNL
ncbi:MAG: HIT domain-containing protein [Candidatus Susulua stagnicola]|nr:HIT domain-containing protein [Candidatus Susulua stagnicola]